MRTAGIVRSERGQAGGYRLNKDPEEITLERVVRLFQGPLAPISCATRHNPEPCPMTIGCTLRDVWEEVRDATISLLGGVTFADLAARAGGPGSTRRLVRRPPSSPSPDRFPQMTVATDREHEPFPSGERARPASAKANDPLGL